MLRVSLLGGLRLEADGVPLAPPSSRKARLLLAMLAWEGRLAREVLAARLWPDVLDESARVSLRTALVQLRSALGPDADRYLDVTRDQVGLSADTTTDVSELERALADGEYDAALELASGELLAGLEEEWVFARRDELRARLSDALARGIAEAEAAGDTAGAARLSRGRAALDPLDEEAHRDLMRRLAAAGDPAAAVAVFEKISERLREQLRVAPSAATRELAQSLRATGNPLAAGLPSGVVTFLLTDIEGSTRLWDMHPDGMARALEHHDELVDRSVSANGGHLLKEKGEGDATLAVFQRASDAVAAAITLRSALASTAWPAELDLRVRIAVHTGEAHERDGDYFGPAVNRAARLRGLARGGATLVSRATAEIVRDRLPDGMALLDLGDRELRGLSRPERVYELVDGTSAAPGPISAAHGPPEGAAPRTRRLLVMAGGGALVALVAAIVVLGRGEESGVDAAALPTATCSPVVSAPGPTPRLLIAADLPLHGIFRSLGAEMDAAIRYVLRERSFQAGRYRLGYQVCDESGRGDPISEERCERNAAAYARTARVVAVIGPFASDCARVQIPINNRAGLAMLSPTNTHPGLTRSGPGAAPGEPDRLYPTGRRNYARVVADDSAQAAANGLLARELGIRRLFVLQSIGDEHHKAMVDGVHYAAERLGVQIVGRAQWEPSARGFIALVDRVRASRPDGVFLGGAMGDNEGRLIRGLRAALPRVRLLAPDGFAGSDTLIDAAGAAAEGMTVSVTGAPPDGVGPRGRDFVERLSADLGVTPEAYSVYAAQAAEVALDAIARSNGTRVSVVRELFRTRVRDGILGDFSFTPAGDTTNRAITVYRIEGGRQEIFRTLAPASELVP